MRIIGQCVCGGKEDAYLEETLKEFKRLCDDAIICLCNATPRAKLLVTAYGFRSYEDNREWGKQQPNIKTDLLKRILQLNPDWILVLDADETMPTVTRETLEQLTVGRESCQFYVVNLWNDEKHFARNMGFFNVRFYKHIPGMETQFLRKNVHCGNAPPYFYTIPAKYSYVPHILLHKGLMKPESRQHRVARYAVYDPRAECKGQQYYDSLEVTRDGNEYVEQEVINNLIREISTYDKQKKTK